MLRPRSASSRGTSGGARRTCCAGSGGRAAMPTHGCGACAIRGPGGSRCSTGAALLAAPAGAAPRSAAAPRGRRAGHLGGDPVAKRQASAGRHAAGLRRELAGSRGDSGGGQRIGRRDRRVSGAVSGRDGGSIERRCPSPRRPTAALPRALFARLPAEQRHAAGARVFSRRWRDAFEQVPDLFCATAQILFPEGERRQETGKAVMPPPARAARFSGALRRSRSRART